jgi:hypothetical protein
MKLFDILKSRWQEAIMVAGLQACFMVLMLDFHRMEEQPPSIERLFFLGIITAWFWVVCQMLLWGFLRTAVTGGTQSVRPMELLRTGRGYFWKLLVFHFMLAAAFLLIIVTVVGGGFVFWGGQMKEEEIPQWLKMISVITASLVLLKPMYFVPAQILRKDCGIREAIYGLKQTHLLRMRYFLITAVSFLALGAIIDYKTVDIGLHSVFYFPVLGVQAMLSASGTLILFLAAVLEVDRLIPKKTEGTGEHEAGQSDNGY